MAFSLSVPTLGGLVAIGTQLEALAVAKSTFCGRGVPSTDGSTFLLCSVALVS